MKRTTSQIKIFSNALFINLFIFLVKKNANVSFFVAVVVFFCLVRAYFTSSTLKFMKYMPDDKSKTIVNQMRGEKKTACFWKSVAYGQCFSPVRVLTKIYDLCCNKYKWEFLSNKVHLMDKDVQTHTDKSMNSKLCENQFCCLKM
jgi:hypothetical protein